MLHQPNSHEKLLEISAGNRCVGRLGSYLYIHWLLVPNCLAARCMYELKMAIATGDWVYPEAGLQPLQLPVELIVRYHMLLSMLRATR
mgnify:CR=1 FL=1